MSKENLKLPNHLIIDKECRELLKYHICTYLMTNEKAEELIKLGIDVIIYNPLKIIYKKKSHWATIVKNKNDDLLYWYLRPYKDSYFSIKTDEHNLDTFKLVVEAVIKNSES